MDIPLVSNIKFGVIYSAQFLNIGKNAGFLSDFRISSQILYSRTGYEIGIDVGPNI